MIDGLFLLLGSNVEGSTSFLQRAERFLTEMLGEPLARSSVYKTEPWGFKEQQWFLNQVLVFDTPSESPNVLLRNIKQLEKRLGRIDRAKWGPREIDIDVLYWGDTIFQNEDLEIPHPAIPSRRFTLQPLVEVAPDKLHPLLGKSQKELLVTCTDASQVILLDNS